MKLIASIVKLIYIESSVTYILKCLLELLPTQMS